MKNENKGITLVALVITIIVLIILAGVSINAVMNDGLIDNSKEAKDSYEKAKKEEEDTIAGLELDGLQIEFLKINSPLSCKYGCITGVSVASDKTIESVDTFKTKLPEGYDIYNGENPATGTVATGMTVKKSGSNEAYTIVVYGDVNMNGEIDDNDGGMVDTFIKKTAQPTLKVQLLAADIDGNGNVNEIDAGLFAGIAQGGTSNNINQNVEAKNPSKIKAQTKKELLDEYVIDKLSNQFKNNSQIDWNESAEQYIIYIEENSIDVATLKKWLQNDTITIREYTTYKKLEGEDKIPGNSRLSMKIYDVNLLVKFEIKQ